VGRYGIPDWNPPNRGPGNALMFQPEHLSIMFQLEHYGDMFQLEHYDDMFRLEHYVISVPVGTLSAF
jgi:hypothetical protein